MVEHSLESPTADHLGDVDLGPADRGAGDVVDLCDVGLGEGCRAVDLDPRVGAVHASRNRDVGVPGVGRSKPMEVRRGDVTQNGSGAACEDRRPPVPLAGEQWQRDHRIDALVATVEAAGGDALVDRARAQPKFAKLIDAENRMPRGSQGRDRRVDGRLAEKPAIFSAFPATLGHSSDRAEKGVMRGQRTVPTRQQRHARALALSRERDAV